MSDSTKDAVIVERTINAPIDTVWQLWTNPEHFKQWYGPEGFSIPVAEMDVQVGGSRKVCMQSPDGNMTMWYVGEFIEVTPRTRLVYSDNMADENGNLMPPNGNFPTQTQVTVVLEAIDGGTKMVMTHAGVPADSGADGGWNQAFNKLERLATSL
ncbi:MAG: SRPBCC domain-containing protein [Chloroflexota bacterium]